MELTRTLQGWAAESLDRPDPIVYLIYVLNSAQATRVKEILQACLGRRRQSGPLGEGQGHPLGKLLCPSGCTVQRHRPASVRRTLQGDLSLELAGVGRGGGLGGPPFFFMNIVYVPKLSAPHIENRAGVVGGVVCGGSGSAAAALDFEVPNRKSGL